MCDSVKHSSETRTDRNLKFGTHTPHDQYLEMFFYQRPFEVGFLNLPPNIFFEQTKIKISSKIRPLKVFKVLDFS